MNIRIVNKSKHELPKYETQASAGMDLMANIDADYRGEIKVILVNLSNSGYKISDGDRIAQMIITSRVQSQLEEADTLSETDRGAGGFGHTGK